VPDFSHGRWELKVSVNVWKLHTFPVGHKMFGQLRAAAATTSPTPVAGRVLEAFVALASAQPFVDLRQITVNSTDMIDNDLDLTTLASRVWRNRKGNSKVAGCTVASQLVSVHFES
jgi:hypothetical protein